MKHIGLLLRLPEDCRIVDSGIDNPAAFDVRNLSSRKGHNPGVGIISVQDIEIVEIPSGSPANNDTFHTH